MVLVKVVSYDAEQLKNLVVCLPSVKGDSEAGACARKLRADCSLRILVSL
jgi:hypothetical protein